MADADRYSGPAYSLPPPATSDLRTRNRASCGECGLQHGNFERACCGSCCICSAKGGGLYVAVVIPFNFGCLKCQPQLHPVSLPCRETKGCAPTSHV